MSGLIVILQVLGVAAAVLVALWAYVYWHQTKALKAEMERLYAAKPGHWKPGEPNPWRGIEYQPLPGGCYRIVHLPYETPTVHEQACEVQAAILEMGRTK